MTLLGFHFPLKAGAPLEERFVQLKPSQEKSPVGPGSFVAAFAGEPP